LQPDSISDLPVEGAQSDAEKSLVSTISGLKTVSYYKKYKKWCAKLEKGDENARSREMFSLY